MYIIFLFFYGNLRNKVQGKKWRKCYRCRLKKRTRKAILTYKKGVPTQKQSKRKIALNLCWDDWGGTQEKACVSNSKTCQSKRGLFHLNGLRPFSLVPAPSQNSFGLYLLPPLKLCPRPGFLTRLPPITFLWHIQKENALYTVPSDSSQLNYFFSSFSYWVSGSDSHHNSSL